MWHAKYINFLNAYYSAPMAAAAHVGMSIDYIFFYYPNDLSRYYYSYKKKFITVFTIDYNYTIKFISEIKKIP